MYAEEQELTGGNVSGRVVRVGETVRKPWIDNTPVVQDYLGAVRARGVDVPKPLGRDQHGRQMLEYIRGDLAIDQLPLGHEDLLRVGRIIRSIHDASESYPVPGPEAWKVLLPADDPDLMCHNDLAPWNLIMGERWVFIDWDGAGPSTRLWDLAYAAQSFGLLFAGQPVREAAVRLRAVVDGYEADQALREALPETMTKRTFAMYELLRSSSEIGFQPWADIYVNGHGEHWQAAAEYVAFNQATWKQALLQTE